MIRPVPAVIAVLATICLVVNTAAASDDDAPIIRMIRAYGGTSEFQPPVVAIEGPNSIAAPTLAQRFATVEFDVAASNIPNVFVRLVHCNADWTESANGFLNDITNRTSIIDWTLAPARSRYHQYRGKLRVPNEQLSIRFPGNWKVRVFDLDTDSLMAETRIFVVLPMAEAAINFMTDFYEPRNRVSGIALTLETVVRADPGRLLDSYAHTVAAYRNHRWQQPFLASQRYRPSRSQQSASYNVLGMLAGGKVFRIERIPAENEYRILDVTSAGMFPSTGAPVRMPFSDQRRNGQFLQRADDGAMSTSGVSSVDDEYLPLEFLLDPAPGRPSDNDVFVVGSFNNWQADRSWQMYYDEALRLYRLRQWVRRGRHNYMYATGTVNADDGTLRDIMFEEFEGNTASAGHGFIAFVYAQMQEYGGYDGIVAVTSSNIYQSGR